MELGNPADLTGDDIVESSYDWSIHGDWGDLGYWDATDSW
jgi:hypothetical protein